MNETNSVAKTFQEALEGPAAPLIEAIMLTAHRSLRRVDVEKKLSIDTGNPATDEALATTIHDAHAASMAMADFLAVAITTLAEAAADCPSCARRMFELAEEARADAGVPRGTPTPLTPSTTDTSDTSTRTGRGRG